MTGVSLIVEGRRHTGWTSVRVTRTIEALAGSFSLTSAMRSDVPIRPESRCQVAIDDETVIDGHVERCSRRLDARTREATYDGYDLAQALVANSVYLDQWSWRDITLDAFARIVAKPHGVNIVVARGLSLPRTKKVVVNPGESAYDALMREATSVGVLLVSDGLGNLVITQGGSSRTDAIVEGENLLSGSVDEDAGERYRRYVVLAGRPGSDDDVGDARRVRAEAVDVDVSRASRVTVLRPSRPMATDAARRFADWRARLHKARSLSVTISVHRWQTYKGTLWPVNAITRVKSPTLGLDRDLLISEATHELGDGGELTTLRLVPPDAFSPSPSARIQGAV
jgi:prophage tail gpP-like protein